MQLGNEKVWRRRRRRRREKQDKGWTDHHEGEKKGKIKREANGAALERQSKHKVQDIALGSGKYTGEC